MEQALTPDRFFGQEDEAKTRSEQEDSGTNKIQPAGDSGATGIFGVLPREPAGAVSPPASSEAASRGQLPVVHSVVFKADSSRKEETDELLNLLRSSPAPAAPAPLASPAPLAPSSGGFTQLLRALNYDQVKEPARTEPVKAEPVAPTAPSPLWQQTQVVPPTPPVSPVQSAPQPVPQAMPQVTSFQPQPDTIQPQPPVSFTQLFQGIEAQPKEPAKREEILAAPTPGSFTQMFETVTPEPVKAHAIVANATVVEPTPAVPIAGPAAPGSFTQMFQALGAAAPAPMMIDSAVAAAGEGAPARSAAEPHPEPVSGTGPTTQLFSTPATSAVKAEPVAPAAHAPGSFTQMFQVISAPPVEAAKVEAAPAAVAAIPQPVTTQPVAPASGSFTQMFRALDAAPVEAVKVEPPSAVSSGPGSFTQMFRALDAAPTQAPPTGPSAGSFTQLFGVGGTAPSTEAPKEYGREAPPLYPTYGQPANVSGDSGASQMFSVHRPTNEPPPPPEPFLSPLQQSAQPPVASSGGLTQLLRALDQPQQAVPRPKVALPTAPPTAGQQPGAFTAMYGTLQGSGTTPAAPPPVSPEPISPQRVSPQQGYAPGSSWGQDATQAFRMPQAAAPPAAPPVQAGPSEFTRILNASVLREAALRGGGASPAPSEGVPPATAAGPAAAPWAMPAAPKAPEVPKMPEAKLPEAPKATVPAAGGMQQYVPLLLILVIFLLLAILVAVIFLMKK